ncbi:TPA: ABC transporter ATP-binding protein, partial [Streptococcus pyogenes]
LFIFLGYSLKSILYSFALKISHKATFSILKNLRISIAQKLPRMPLGKIIDTSSGEFKTTIVDQVEKMERPLAHLLPEMTANILGPLFIIIYLLIIDWRLAILSLVSIPVGMMFMGLIMKDYASDYAKSVEVNTNMNKSIVEYINGIEVIKTFNQGENSYSKYENSIYANAEYFYKWMKKTQFSMSLSKAISPTTLITILPIGFLMYIGGSLEISSFIMVIILSLGVAGPLLAAINFIDSLAQVGTTVNRIDSILAADEQIHSDNITYFENYDIKIKDLHFAYDENKEILKGVDLFVEENTVNALVGPSGSGKSTIAKLIAGYWDISDGVITIGDKNILDIPLRQLYDLVAFVSQDTFLFNDTVMENIRMGKVNSSDDEVIEMAKASGCHEFIMSLEKGYQTIVGSGGSNLSGGERQRITIARAMLKNAPILILDEATAYIDPENEVKLQESISKLIEGKTVIIIAHRLSTVTDVDKIFLVEDGKISCAGNHEELLNKSNTYKDMWKANQKK